MAVYDLAGVDLIRVSSTSGRVELVAESRRDLSASIGDVTVDGATLTVEVGSHPVELRVPEGIAVVVGTDSARVTLIGPLGPVSASSDTGRIVVDRASSADVRSTSGRVEVGSCDSACRARSASGSIRIGQTGDVDAHTESGRIEVASATGTVNARTTSGRVEVNVDGPSDVVAETMTGRIVISLAGGLGARVDAASGTGRIESTAPAGDECRVVARSVSGRIRVQAR